MNRVVFITLFIITFIGAYIALKYNVENIFLINLVVFSLLVFLRRRYLKMKPWWGGKLKDIPKYFQLP